MRRKATWGIPGTMEGCEGLPYTSSATGAPRLQNIPGRGHLRHPLAPSPEAVLHWVSWRWPGFLKIHLVLLQAWSPDLVSTPTWELVRKAHSQVVPRPAESEVLGVSDSSAHLMVTEFENLCALGRLLQSKERKTTCPAP